MASSFTIPCAVGREFVRHKQEKFACCPPSRSGRRPPGRRHASCERLVRSAFPRGNRLFPIRTRLCHWAQQIVRLRAKARVVWVVMLGCRDPIHSLLVPLARLLPVTLLPV